MDLHEQGMSSRTFVIAAIVCVLLQAGLAPQISIAGGRVNFKIILVVWRRALSWRSSAMRCRPRS